MVAASKGRPRYGAYTPATNTHPPPAASCLLSPLPKSTHQQGGTRPLVVAYGAAPPSSVRPLLDESPPLPKLGVRSAAEVEVVSLTDAASCIRGAARLPGALVIWDDGTVPDLAALSNLRAVAGPLIVFGVGGRSGLKSLAGLDKLEVALVSGAWCLEGEEVEEPV